MDFVRKPCSVSIVIRAFNEERHIERLLTGILRQDLRDSEIILVDSGSTDETLEIASRYPVKILSISPDEFSFGRSINIGCAEARGEYVVLASAHVYPVYASWLGKLLVPFSDPGVALAYGKQRGCGSTKFSEHQVFRKWFPDEPCVSQSEPFCNNANAVIQRKLWEMNPYDESLTGLEDVAWAQSMIERGYKIAYVPGAEVVHVHEESVRQIYNRYRREAIALKRILPRETFSYMEFLRLLTSNIGSDFYHAWRGGMLFRRAFEIFGFRLMQFCGTYRGFRQEEPVTSELKQTFYYPPDFHCTSPPAEESEEPRRIAYSRPKAEE